MLHSAEERAREREIRATAVPALRPPRQETVYISLTRRQKVEKRRRKFFSSSPIVWEGEEDKAVHLVSRSSSPA
jgi:hypothetical protein